jgi:hypothetical protein
MTDKQLADIICRALITIVVALKRRYDLPDYRNIVIVFQEKVEIQK